MGSLPAPRKIFPDFEAEMGFSGIHCIMFSERAFPSAPLSTTAEIFTILFLVLSSATCSNIMLLSSSHRDPRTVPRLSEHPRHREPCWRFRDLRVTTVHPASLNASRSPGGELIKRGPLPVVLFSPAAFFIGVFSFGASCSNLAECPIPPHK